jgi:hypothetical protein
LHAVEGIQDSVSPPSWISSHPTVSLALGDKRTDTEIKERKRNTPQLVLLLPLDHHSLICCEVSTLSEKFVHIRN